MHSYQELLRNTLRGDKQSFSEVVRRFSGMARAVAVRQIRDNGLAEDAVQEAFLTAYLSLPSLRSLDAFPSWLRSILATCSAQMLRSRVRHVSLTDLGEVENLPSDELDPLEHYAKLQTRDMVLATLDSLGGVYREAAVQRYIHGRPYEEISDALGVPVGTIKRRLHEVRARLLCKLSGEGATIRVGYLPISDHLLAMVTHQRQDQAAFGIMLRKFLSWASLTKALINGTLDAAMVMAPLAMALRNRGAPLRYVLDCHHEGSAITVRKALISRKAAGRDWTRALDGAIIGLPHAKSTHGVLLKSALGFGKEDSGTPRPRYLSPPFLQQPFKRGEIDGFFCAEPWSTLSESRGEGTVLVRSGKIVPGHACCVLVVTQAFAGQNPRIVSEYLRLLKSAGEYVHAHPQESADIQARYTGVDMNAARHVLESGFISFRDLDPDPVRAGQSMNLALQAGVLDRPCRLTDFLAPVMA